MLVSVAPKAGKLLFDSFVVWTLKSSEPEGVGWSEMNDMDILPDVKAMGEAVNSCLLGNVQ